MASMITSSRFLPSISRHIFPLKSLTSAFSNNNNNNRRLDPDGLIRSTVDNLANNPDDTFSTLTKIGQSLRVQSRSRKRIILQKKLLKPPPQLSVLTWEGRVQLLHLIRKHEGEGYNAELLATKFPITPEGITRVVASASTESSALLKKNPRKSFNRTIVDRLKQISEILTQFARLEELSITKANEIFAAIPNELLWLFSESKFSLLKFANGNPDLPFPDVKEPKAVANIAHSSTGLFGKMVQSSGLVDPPSVCVPLEEEQDASDLVKLIECFEQIDRPCVLVGSLPLQESTESYRFLRRLMATSRRLANPPKAVHPIVIKNKPSSKLTARIRKPSGKYLCDWPGCEYALKRIPFKYESILLRHTSVHSCPDPLSCSDCGEKFNTMENLTRHRTIHSGLKMFTCNVCNRAYKRSSTRSACQKHHQLETNVKAVMTTSAAKGDSGLSALEREMARPRPYHCTLCRRAYTDPGSLRKHRRQYHSSETKKPNSGATPSLQKNSTSKPSLSLETEPSVRQVSTINTTYAPYATYVPTDGEDDGVGRTAYPLLDPQVPPHLSTHGSLNLSSALNDGRHFQAPCHEATQSVCLELVHSDSDWHGCPDATAPVHLINSAAMEISSTPQPPRSPPSSHPTVINPELTQLVPAIYYTPYALTWVSQSAVESASQMHYQHQQCPVYWTEIHPHMDDQTGVHSSQSLTFDTTTNMLISVPTVDDGQYPVDLCNSAMCLQTIPVQPVDVSIYQDNNATTTGIHSHRPPPQWPSSVFLSDSDVPPSGLLDVPNEIVRLDRDCLAEDIALDLREPFIANNNSSAYCVPIASGTKLQSDGVIDLSGDAVSLPAPITWSRIVPIDLSATPCNTELLVPTVSMSEGTSGYPGHPNGSSQQIVTFWDPEPGFSFTDLLTNTDMVDDDAMESVFQELTTSMQESPLNCSPLKLTIPMKPPAPPLDLRLTQIGHI